MFGLFKTKKQKQEDAKISLEQELKSFTEKYKDYFNCYAFTGRDIVIYKEPKIQNNKLVMAMVTVDTPKDYFSIVDIWILQLKYGDDFLKNHRNNFIRLKDQMEKFGIRVEKIKNE